MKNPGVNKILQQYATNLKTATHNVVIMCFSLLYGLNRNIIADMVVEKEYEITQLSPLYADISRLLEGEYTSIILECAALIIETEAPITEELLSKRVMNSLGIQKIGSRIRSYLDSVIPYILSTKETIEDQVIYHKEEEENYYRPQVNGDERFRYSHQIPYTEAMLVVEAIYQDDEDTRRGLQKKELSQRFLTRLGYTKHGSSIDALFETVFHILRENNVLLKNSSGKFVFQ